MNYAKVSIMLNVGTQKEAAAGVVFVWTVSFVGLISRLQYNSVDLLDYSSLIISVIIGGFLVLIWVHLNSAHKQWKKLWVW